MKTEDRVLSLLCEWAAFGDKRRFVIEYGCGVSEAPVVSLFEDERMVGFALVESNGLLAAAFVATKAAIFGAKS